MANLTMRSRRTRRNDAVAAVVLALGVLATACGGGGEDTASSKADAPAAAVTAGSEDKASSGGGNFCDLVKAQSAELASDDQGFGFLDDATSTDPAVRRRAFDKLKASNAELLKASPRGIRSDMEIQVRAQEAMMDAQIRGDQAAASALVTAPEFQAATARVGTYLKDQCGIDYTTSGGG